MAAPVPRGNLPGPLFPRLLLGLSVKMNLDGEALANRLLNSGLSLLLNLPHASRGARSALQQRIDSLLELLERGLALDLLAIDEEGRRRIHLEHLGRVFLISDELVEQRLVVEAGLDLLLAEAGLLADPRQRLRGVLHHPVGLRTEQEIDDGKIFAGVAVGDAARQHRTGRRLDVERELTEDVTDLAGVDELRLDLREYVGVEGRAVRAGHRGVFGDRDLGVRGSERHVRQRHRLGDIGGALGQRFADQPQRRERAEGRQAGQGQGGGCEGAARDGDQRSAPDLARLAPETHEMWLFASLKQLWRQWPETTPGPRENVNFA